MIESHYNFKTRVLDIVRGIEKGKVITYSKVAKSAGSLGAARAVGTIMKNNYDVSVPCHRVVKSDGSVGDYNRGSTEEKINILKKEGVKFDSKNRIIF